MSASAGGLRPARSVVYAAALSTLPAWARQVLASVAPDARVTRSASAAVDEVRRSLPAIVLLHAGRGGLEDVAVVLSTLKGDAYTAVIPCVVYHHGADNAALLRAGADEVIDCEHMANAEGASRIEAAVRRSTRDLSAQPTTRLPGAGAIEAEISRRLRAGEAFAACYADLDHFKEFNDRYGYHEGDRVIRMVGRMLHDVAVGIAQSDAFVGHVGGDDFMLVLPLGVARPVCELALEVFDVLVPYQYTVADRRAGYYFGKDRRGQLHRVPLMTLSIGAATTERRWFDSAADVSRLASEMKSFAKARPGSVLAVDRRGEQDASLLAGGLPRTIL